MMAPGCPFPDLALADHAGNERLLSELVAGDPAVLQFYRGWWCPKEQAFFRRLLALQDGSRGRVLPVRLGQRRPARGGRRLSRRPGRAGDVPARPGPDGTRDARLARDHRPGSRSVRARGLHTAPRPGDPKPLQRLLVLGPA